MKKKIINGILMAAMLFAGTTSFVSCKDNVDDVASGIYKDLDKVKNDLQSQITALDTRLTSLEGRVGTLESQVTALQNEVAQIKQDIQALSTRVTNLEDEQTKLKNRIADAEAKIVELENYMKYAIYDVKIEETNDAVLGTINLPGIQIPTMMTYYGLNASGITRFPTTKSNVHVYGAGDEYHVNGQYASDIDPFMTGVRPIEFEGLGAQLAQYTNNTGTIYFSVNPVGVDLTGVTFDFIDSKGNVYPYEISDVKGSDHWLSVAAGKTGYGRDEASETDNVNLYQAKVHLPMAKWEQAISFNIHDSWNNVFKQGEAADLLKKVKESYSTGGKTEASKTLIKEALQFIQNNYQATYNTKMKLKYQSLRATGKVNVAKSSTNLIVAAVEPLSYKTFWMLDQDGRNVIKSKFDIESIEKAIAALAKAIAKAIPNKQLDDVQVSTSWTDATYAYFVVTNATGDAMAPGSTWTINMPLSTYEAQTLIDLINNGMTDIVNEYIKKINKVLKAVTDPDTDALLTKARSFLEKVSAKIMNMTGGTPFYNAVTPIILFEGPEGVNRLVPGATLEILNNRMTVILTSPTEEYLVPAMYKYIAVRYKDQLVDSKILSGQEKVTAIELHQGECEIIYQTVDYAGYVVTKSYPVTVK